jgi:hypothetical protein
MPCLYRRPDAGKDPQLPFPLSSGLASPIAPNPSDHRAEACLILLVPDRTSSSRRSAVEKREGALATYESPRCATLTEGRVFVTRSTSRSYIVSLRSDSKKESPVERWLSPDERVRFVDISFIGQSNRNRECADECSATRRSCRK